MPFPNLIHLNDASVQSVKYFVDANIWIYSLQKFDDLKPWEDNYYQFFFDIVESKLDPKPKILLPPILLSEIINTYLRKFAMSEYKIINKFPPNTILDFKRDYRPTQHYRDSYEKMIDDISSLHASIEFLDDSLIAHDTTVLYQKNIGTFDYNDHVFFSLCKEYNKVNRLIMVTNDGDYAINDFEILTLNRTLLALR